MGIRINKTIGYGLTDIKVDDKDRIIDDRFSDQYLGDDDFLSEFEMVDFLNYLKEAYEKGTCATLGFHASIELYSNICIYTVSELLSKKEKLPSEYDLFTWQGEMGDPKVMVFTPLSMTRYNRYDDLIDYYESSGQVNVNILDRPIYPFDSWMNKRTGKKIRYGSELYSWMRIMSSKNDFDVSSIELPKSLFDESGFTSYNDAKENLTPSIPDEVTEFCRYTNIFKNISTVWEFKPIIYTYWS
jgi:hypothetical protein